MNIEGAQINQGGTVADKSSFTPGLTSVGNDGFFSISTCNLVKFGNSKAASSAVSTTDKKAVDANTQAATPE